MTQTGSAKPLMTGELGPASQADNHTTSLSGTTSAAIMFGRLKDWRRIATRYDRCPKVFLSAIALAATVLFWL